jgi:FkbM family methyltransferase
MPVSLRGGPTLLVRPGDSDIEVLRQVFIDRQYELWVEPTKSRIRRAYEAILAEGAVPVIVDAGANIGASAIWFSDLYPKARVVAIEPDPRSAELLRHNVAGYPAILALEAALGGEPGHVSILPADKAWTVRTERSDGGCPIVTVAEAVARVTEGKPFIVKVDIEGFEHDVFAANTDWLDEVFVAIIEPHDWILPGQGTSLSFQRELGRREFEMLLLHDQICYVRHEGI